MPIDVKISTREIDERGFKKLDYFVMGLAFKIHNDLGCLCNEKVYQAEMVRRISSEGGYQVLREWPVLVSHREFSKTYFLDLLVDSVVYELKAVETLTPIHEAQALNYLMLCGLKFGKIVNFRTPSVEGRYVNSNLSPSDRRRFSIDDSHWIHAGAESMTLRETIIRLVSDWGMFLETSLYQEALLSLLSGFEVSLLDVELVRDGVVVGTHKFPMLNRAQGFKVTSVVNFKDRYHANLVKLLKCTRLSHLYWINFNHHVLEMRTLTQ